MKLLIQILFLFASQTLLGQSSIDTTAVLKLNQKKNYKEVNKFWLNNGLVLYQVVDFNDPKVIDDEYSQILSIIILDSTIKTGQRSFDLLNDSGIIKCNYDKQSTWQWSKRNVKTIGQVKIISLTKHRIEAEFDLIVTDQGKGIYVYQGRRLFKKSKPLITKL